jgi:hypothetical protein
MSFRACEKSPGPRASPTTPGRGESCARQHAALRRQAVPVCTGAPGSTAFRIWHPRPCRACCPPTDRSCRDPSPTLGRGGPPRWMCGLPRTTFVRTAAQRACIDRRQTLPKLILSMLLSAHGPTLHIDLCTVADLVSARSRSDPAAGGPHPAEPNFHQFGCFSASRCVR